MGLCANDYLDREVDASLSGGEVKRIEIATILARNANIFHCIALITMVFSATERRYSYNEYRLYYSYFPTQKRENILWKGRNTASSARGCRSASAGRMRNPPSLSLIHI